jgi:hypothetical protein
VHRTIPRRPVVAAALAALLTGVVLAPPASAPAREREPEPTPARIVKTKRIAPGLIFTKIVEKKIPRRTFVLRVDLRKQISLDVTLAGARLPARRTLSEIAKRAGALAGVNGDYGLSRPVHPMAQDGELVQTSDQLGTLFAVTRDESTVLFGKPSVRVAVTDLAHGRTFALDRWNRGAPAPGEIAGFSPLGGTLEPPPPYSCSVRLLPTGPPVPADGDGVERDFLVDVATCSEEPLTRDGGVVLSAAPATDEATMLLALAPGTPMRLRWTFGWADVFDAIGGGPLLLQDGVPTGQCNSGCGIQPRTGVGVTATGRILLVVVDGRKPRWSIGVSATELAAIMRELGAVTALNLDGGGSTTMVVNGEVVNRPSDGHERAISNAILILPGPDPGEATG